MTQGKSELGGAPGYLGGGHLKELAREAVRHLDDVLPADDSAVRPAHEDARCPTSAASSALRGAARNGMLSRVRGASRSAPRPPSAFASTGAAKALVAHVCPGTARVLANVLRHQGLEVEVADDPGVVASALGKSRWDIAFVQGTAMPYPGKRISLAALAHCADSGTPVVLLTRRGDDLIAEAAGSNAVGLLQWPFRMIEVAKVLSETLSDKATPSLSD